MELSNLPIIDIKKDILETLLQNNRLIIKSPTGSGKSTQVPQFILDSKMYDGKILVLQPRRIAAKMLCSRVSEERGCNMGTEIGFLTRYEKSVSDLTRIVYITEGILPRLLMTDKTLKDVSVIIFDEFHERSVTVDFALALTKNLQETVRPDLKMIIMSATIETGFIKEYLPGVQQVTSSGRMYPVNIEYSPVNPETEIWDAAAAALKDFFRKNIDGDILIFMPGISEIRKTAATIKKIKTAETIQVLMLYGDLPLHKQQEVLRKTDKRKVIISTNVAETSLTISGVRHVIDSGLCRCSHYDESKGLNSLFIEKIAMDSADQRAGRAGREGSGTCIRLWSYTDQTKRPQRTTPEIFRIDLSEIVLQMIALGHTDVDTFDWLEHPGTERFKAAGMFLFIIGVITEKNELTPEGKLVASLPMHPRLAKLIVECEKRGVVRTGAFVAAILSERPVYFGHPDLPEEISRNSNQNDFYLTAMIIDKIIQSNYDNQTVESFNASISSIKQLLQSIAFYLQVCRKQKMHTRNKSDDPDALAKALLSAYTDRVARKRDSGSLFYVLPDEKTVELTKSSCAKKSEYIVATTIRTIETRKGEIKTLITNACGINKYWIKELFPDGCQTGKEFVWNSIKQEVEHWESEICMGIVLSKNLRDHPDPEGCGIVLANEVIGKKMKLSGWNSEVKEFLTRFQRVADRHTGLFKLTYQVIERACIQNLCKNEIRYKSVKDKPVLPYVKDLFTSEELGYIDRFAPEYYFGGQQKFRLQYSSPDKAPVLRGKLQDLIEIKTNPFIDSAPVTIEILDPENRCLCKTQNISLFWEKEYPALLSKLKKKYPKIFT